MFRILTLLFILFVSSCEQTNEIEKNPKIKNRQKPSEPCEEVSWCSTPIITHGYSVPEQKIIIESYVKNSNFDSLVKKYELVDNNGIRDKERQERSFSLPQELNSNVDLKIIIDKDEFFITEVKTAWIPRVGQKFLGYSCSISSFKTNGTPDQGNINLKNPRFKYPWEK